MAAVSGLLGLLAWWLTKDWRWIVGAVLILANWPYTLLVIKPTNDTLNATAADKADTTSRALIEKWGGCMRCGRRSVWRRRWSICGR